MTVGTLMTADELLRLPDDGSRHELVQGELRKMSPTGEDRGSVSMQITMSLANYVYTNGLGKVYPADTGFRLFTDPDTVRAPDVSFVRAERVRRSRKYIDGPPDVAFEVVSPTDRYAEIVEKVRDYLRAGSEVVVIVDPESRTVTIQRAAGTTEIGDVLEIPDIFAGWTLPLVTIFG